MVDIPNIGDCTKCPLHEDARCVGVRGRGSRKPMVMFVGEAPGKHEDREGIAFVGESGKLMDRICKEVGLDKYRYENVVKCIPWDDGMEKVRRPTEDETKACSPYLLADIYHYQPAVLMAVGATAAKFLTGKGQITKIAGTVQRARLPKYRWVNEERTEVERVEGEDQEWVIIPTVHPAAILYAGYRDNPAESPTYQEIKRHVSLAREMSLGEEAEKADYAFVNSLPDLKAMADEILEAYRKGDIKHVSVDIETTESEKKFDPDGKLWTIQFSWKKQQSRCLLVEHPNSALNTFQLWRPMAKQVRRILEEVPVVGQGFQYDWTWLYYYFGVRCKVQWDTLFMHHCLHMGALPNDLDYMSAKYLRRGSHKWRMLRWLEETGTSRGDMYKAPDDIYLEYACGDTDSVFELVPILRRALKKRERPMGGTLLDTYVLLYRRPFDLMMELTVEGARILKERYEKLQAEYPKQVEEAGKKITDTPFYEAWRELNKLPNKKHWVSRKRIVAWKCKCGCGNKYKWHELPHNRQAKLRFKGAQIAKPKVGAEHRCPRCGTWNELDPIRLEPKVLKTEEYVTPKGHTRTRIVQAEPVRNKYATEYVYQEFNPRSTPMVGSFFDVMKLPYDYDAGLDDDEEEDDDDVVGEEEGKRSTKRKVVKNLIVWCRNKGLEEHAKVLEDILAYRKVAHAYTAFVKKLPRVLSYMDNAPENDRPCRQTQVQSMAWTVHASFKLSGTRTGRLSSSEPSLQQIPKKSIIKWMYVSKWYEQGGLFMLCDYSQMELRLLAMLCRDPGLLGAFERGEDVHLAVAALMWGKKPEDILSSERTTAKTFNFGILYGKGEASLAYELQRTVEQVQEMLELYWENMPKVRDYIEDQYDLLDEIGESWTPTGRCRPLKEIFRRNSRGQVKALRRKMVNTPIQGGASDMALLTAVDIREERLRRNLKSVQFDQVHDSIDYDVYPGELVEMAKLVLSQAEETPKQFEWSHGVPIVVDIEVGTDWQRVMGMKYLRRSKRGDEVKFSGSPDYWPDIKSHLAKGYKVKTLQTEEYVKDDKPAIAVTVRLTPRPVPA